MGGREVLQAFQDDPALSVSSPEGSREVWEKREVLDSVGPRQPCRRCGTGAGQDSGERSWRSKNRPVLMDSLLDPDLRSKLAP